MPHVGLRDRSRSSRLASAVTIPARSRRAACSGSGGRYAATWGRAPRRGCDDARPAGPPAPHAGATGILLCAALRRTAAYRRRARAIGGRGRRHLDRSRPNSSRTGPMMLPVVAGGGRRILPRSLRKSSFTLAESRRCSPMSLPSRTAAPHDGATDLLPRHRRPNSGAVGHLSARAAASPSSQVARSKL